ncbi:hypothetical protein jaqu_05940 [Jannaschia aquimarina]|uniref:Uncharacterized protein n=1 Tax=Jannaschia aquimarina TaxID=935700 RepID=A0A0D1DCJ3_9RHOB|nr:hypothetical protein jaqu_05940 [Jannaschia aquimarina]SNS78642.1 hypothetical protein SAMN05421775_102287 [Jannaschia aquimarina]
MGSAEVAMTVSMAAAAEVAAATEDPLVAAQSRR